MLCPVAPGSDPRTKTSLAEGGWPCAAVAAPMQQGCNTVGARWPHVTYIPLGLSGLKSISTHNSQDGAAAGSGTQTEGGAVREPVAERAGPDQVQLAYPGARMPAGGAPQHCRCAPPIYSFAGAPPYPDALQVRSPILTHACTRCSTALQVRCPRSPAMNPDKAMFSSYELIWFQ